MASTELAPARPESTRCVVTWRLAPGVASALHDLAEWRDMTARRSRLFESVLRSGIPQHGGPSRAALGGSDGRR